eukprot:TRINITY_DN33263_c0_g1_i1.p1 TRINITY_DN33263_c0_g1~~TRINITY_DN33263_c0_g1_i1.p1  ORF type:complete len:949 (-),score=156.46 TRINITY_DN33263_c0_g1_i1:282-3128(-)
MAKDWQRTRELIAVVAVVIAGAAAVFDLSQKQTDLKQRVALLEEHMKSAAAERVLKQAHFDSFDDARKEEEELVKALEVFPSRASYSAASLDRYDPLDDSQPPENLARNLREDTQQVVNETFARRAEQLHESNASVFSDPILKEFVPRTRSIQSFLDDRIMCYKAKLQNEGTKDFHSMVIQEYLLRPNALPPFCGTSQLARAWAAKYPDSLLERDESGRSVINMMWDMLPQGSATMRKKFPQMIVIHPLLSAISDIFSYQVYYKDWFFEAGQAAIPNNTWIGTCDWAENVNATLLLGLAAAACSRSQIQAIVYCKPEAATYRNRFGRTALEEIALSAPFSSKGLARLCMSSWEFLEKFTPTAAVPNAAAQLISNYMLGGWDLHETSGLEGIFPGMDMSKRTREEEQKKQQPFVMEQLEKVIDDEAAAHILVIKSFGVTHVPKAREGFHLWVCKRLIRKCFHLDGACDDSAPSGAGIHVFPDGTAMVQMRSDLQVLLQSAEADSVFSFSPKTFLYLENWKLAPKVFQLQKSWVTTSGKTVTEIPLLHEAAMNPNCSAASYDNTGTAVETLAALYHKCNVPMTLPDDDGVSPEMAAASFGNLHAQQTIFRYVQHAEEKKHEILLLPLTRWSIPTVIFICFLTVFALAFFGCQSGEAHVHGLATRLFMRDVEHTLLKAALLFLVDFSVLYGEAIASTYSQGHLGNLTLVLNSPQNISPGAVRTVIIAICASGALLIMNDIYEVCVSFRKAGELLQDPDTQITAKDIYQDPKAPFMRCVFTFLAAGCLFLIYQSYFVKLIEMSAPARLYWMLALLVQVQMSIGRQLDVSDSRTCSEKASSLVRWALCMGKDTVQQAELWRALLTGSVNDSNEPTLKLKLGRPEVVFRLLASYISNGMFRAVILWTLPIYLAESCEKPIDFVLNASALAYIYEFDDVDEDAVYTVSADDGGGD